MAAPIARAGRHLRLGAAVCLMALAGCAVQDGRLTAVPPYDSLDQDTVNVAALITASLLAIAGVVALGREFD